MTTSSIIRAVRGAAACISSVNCWACPYNDYLPSTGQCKAKLMNDLYKAITELEKKKKMKKELIF